MSGPWHPSGRARVSARKPEAIGVCQRCGFWYNRAELVPQFEWAGVQLQNQELYVCTRTCYDKPQQQLKTIIIPPDPMPVYRPFPEPFSQEDVTTPVAQTFIPAAAAMPPGFVGPSTPTNIPSFAQGPMVHQFIAEPVGNWEAEEDGPLPDPANPHGVR
ncbi:hypothetical protein [Bradyrhizobium cenepequi]|uniref:hypothetical protein n=1 Tax=Bradyrhizobium cenepequi TaxID=2821403 RepID=UPI001CE3640F|nr:hypothetical protein [Bradyrhizobium cenepequi]MCA6108098.1 hypothetical protein [Bradyrhizobium cenepequi]